MYKYYVCLLALMLSGLLSACAPSASRNSKNIVMRFETVFDNLATRDNSERHAREYWKNIEGRSLNSSGIVTDIRGWQNMKAICVVNRCRPTFDGYNILLLMSPAHAEQIKKDAYINFQGVLQNFKSTPAGLPTIVLTDVAIMRNR